jgi:hypothetical protein
MSAAEEVFNNEASATITVGGSTTPAQGTTETWTSASMAKFVNGASSSATPPTQFRVVDPNAPSEIILVTNQSGSGGNTLTVTRGAEGTTPVSHTEPFTIEGVITVGGLENLSSPNSWIPAPFSLTYSSTDTSGHAFTYSTSGDLTPYISVGYRFRLHDSSNGTQYFIVVAITSTTITLYGGNTYSATGTITLPYYSQVNTYGFPNYGWSSPIFQEANSSPGFVLNPSASGAGIAVTSPSGVTFQVTPTQANTLTVGMTVTGAGITAATISSIAAPSGGTCTVTLTGTIGTLTASTYQFYPNAASNNWYTSTGSGLWLPPGVWNVEAQGTIFAAILSNNTAAGVAAYAAITTAPSGGWVFGNGSGTFAATSTNPFDDDLVAAAGFLYAPVPSSGTAGAQKVMGQVSLRKTIVLTAETQLWLALAISNVSGTQPYQLQAGVGGQSPVPAPNFVFRASCAYLMPS